MSVEQEIKLQVIDDKAIDLSALPWLMESVEGAVETKLLANTYFDTLDLSLIKQGIGLRLRKIDQRWLQTVKTSGVVKNGLHQRNEWEHELQSADWDIALLKQTPLEVMINDPNIWSQVAPIFNTDFERKIMPLRIHNTQIELAYDRGQVQAGSHKVNIHEIELELKTGSIEVLTQLADKFCQVLAVQYSDVSKAQRGYQLLEKVKLT